MRVLSFKSICSEATSSSSSNGKDGNLVYEKLGQLMNGSQESLRDYYQASCQEINDVVEIARANGALGSRFTGEFSRFYH